VTHVSIATGGSRKTVLTGHVLSGIVILFLLIDAGMKLAVLQPVVEASRQLGWPADGATVRMLGLVLLICTILYAVPRTAVLGALLLTAFLGGAVATHARIGSPLFSHVLFGVYVGVLMWGGLWLRDERVRALLPFAA
jgi:hypothetical protein